MQSIIIGANEAGQRFDKFLHKYLPEAPNSFLYKMLRKKNITLNGKKADGKEILVIKDEVTFFFSDETLQKFSGTSFSKSQDSREAMIESYEFAYKSIKGISIIYEDNHVLILNKPVGVLTQKAAPSDISINEWMIGYLLHTKSITSLELKTFRPSVCNRLDRNTSGLVLCGKSLAGSQALSQIIRERTLKKYYRTLVGGKIEKENRIKGVLVKDSKTNTVTVSPSTSMNKGDSIETGYKPLYSTGKLTFLEVELITGKTHQIRAHLSSIGHPLIGDSKYGNTKLNEHFRKEYKLKSQLLHAFCLEFPQLDGALTEVSMKKFVAPLPDFFQKILNTEHIK